MTFLLTPSQVTVESIMLGTKLSNIKKIGTFVGIFINYRTKTGFHHLLGTKVEFFLVIFILFYFILQNQEMNHSYKLVGQGGA